MEIIIGETAGFCYGVERAVTGAKQIIENQKENIYCFGEIVHNQKVIQDLKDKGIRFIEKIEEAKGDTIIRAHGIEKEILNKAKKMGIKMIDYTCPKVIKIHNIAEEFSNKGYYIFLIGAKKHPENIGTISYCGKKYSVIEEVDDTYTAIKELEKSKVKQLLVISQTTYSIEKFHKIEEIIKKELKKDIKVEIKNTICKATELRQKETEKISKTVECMIIVGGKNSSNTKKLYEIAKENCQNAIWIEDKKEIEISNIRKFNKIGIMAGASTPQESINEIVETLNKLQMDCKWRCANIASGDVLILECID